MAASNHQRNVADYHRAMTRVTGHAHGHDMYLFHRDWHARNPDPTPPAAPDRVWGMDQVFGTNFLQMHHEMVKAADDEPKSHMLHASLFSWYAAQRFSLPAEWNPPAPIPPALAYDPDPDAYPAEIRDAVAEAAHQAGVTAEQWLTRDADAPAFVLPKWFTRAGVGPGEASEPYTGARKLADFLNTNQLGCCLVFPHNAWHAAIGGAMRSTWTAIADPVFYFGVHRHVDAVFDEFKIILVERALHRLDPPALARAAVEAADVPTPAAFTAEQQAARATDIALSAALRRRPTGTLRPVSAVAAAVAVADAQPARLDIQQLMAVEQHDIVWLRQALQRAIELEFFTIPPYLCAWWSIRTGGFKVRARLKSIVLEEMFHFSLACNMLNAIGGHPEIDTHAAAPKYPRELPGGVHPGLTVALEKLSKEVVLTKFMEIEKPEWPGLVTAAFAGETYATIGQFYQAVRSAFGHLADGDIKPVKQCVYPVGDPSPRVFAIATKADALQAIDRICAEGEGTPQTPNNPAGKPAHFYQFGEIYHEKAVNADPSGWHFNGDEVPFPTAIRDMAPVPDGGYAKSLGFDQAYSALLAQLQEAWDNGDSGVLTAAVSAMGNLTDLALPLMEAPILGGVGNYGPSFLRVPIVTTPVPPTPGGGPPVAATAEADMLALIAFLSAAPHNAANRHTGVDVGGGNLLVDLFATPAALLTYLKMASLVNDDDPAGTKLVMAGKPDESAFFRLIQRAGHPMKARFALAVPGVNKTGVEVVKAWIESLA